MAWHHNNNNLHASDLLKPQHIRYNATQNSHFVSHFTVGYVSRFRISQLAENEAASSSLYHPAM